MIKARAGSKGGLLLPRQRERLLRGLLTIDQSHPEDVFAMFRPVTRFTRMSALLLSSACLPLIGAAQVTFSSHSFSPSTLLQEVAGHGDFNGDGREDLLIKSFGTAANPQAFPLLVYLSTADGTYAAPVTLPSPATGGSVVIGDFNHDGKLDLATTTAAGSQLEIYLGNGDGTFQVGKPLVESGSAQENTQSIVAADMNHDGKTDLVQIVSNNNTVGNQMQIWLSKGDGTFTAGQRVTGIQAGPAQGELGDFDGDGKPDIAILQGFEGASSVTVYYGDNAGHLGSPASLTDPNGYDDFYSSSPVGDVLNVGRSAIVSNRTIYGIEGTGSYLPQIGIFQGNANRTLSFQVVNTTQCPIDISVADFDGDGLNDLAYSSQSCSGSQSGQVNFDFKKGLGGGTFADEQLFYETMYYAGGDMQLLKSSAETRPDLVFSQDTGPLNASNNAPQELTLLENASTSSTTFPGCNPPGGAGGINVCAPGASATSPVKFSIGATGPTPMRTVAVWADGKKVSEQLAHAFSNYSFLDASVALSTGSHAITLYGTGLDNTLQTKSFTLQVGAGGGGCAAPASAGIDICSPVNGATVSSPVTVSATGTVTGTFLRFEVWVDGVKKFTSTTTDGANLSLALAAGKHTFSFYAVNTAGTKWNKVSVVTVK